MRVPHVWPDHVYQVVQTGVAAVVAQGLAPSMRRRLFESPAIVGLANERPDMEVPHGRHLSTPGSAPQTKGEQVQKATRQTDEPVNGPFVFDIASEKENPAADFYQTLWSQGPLADHSVLAQIIVYEPGLFAYCG